MKWHVRLHKQAMKDLELLKRAGLAGKVKALLDLLEDDPFRTPPPCEKLQGDLTGTYSWRINVQHKLIYDADKENHVVSVYRMWMHYE